MDAQQWLARLGAELGTGDAVPDEGGVRDLLDLTREVAHGVERVAGPLSTFLVGVAVGDAVFEGHPLVYIEPGDVAGLVDTVTHDIDLDAVRLDVAQIIERHEITLDAARPDAVARRRKTGQRRFAFTRLAREGHPASAQQHARMRLCRPRASSQVQLTTGALQVSRNTIRARCTSNALGAVRIPDSSGA